MLDYQPDNISHQYRFLTMLDIHFVGFLGRVHCEVFRNAIVLMDLSFYHGIGFLVIIAVMIGRFIAFFNLFIGFYM